MSCNTGGSSRQMDGLQADAKTGCWHTGGSAEVKGAEVASHLQHAAANGDGILQRHPAKMMTVARGLDHMRIRSLGWAGLLVTAQVMGDQHVQRSLAVCGVDSVSRAECWMLNGRRDPVESPPGCGRFFFF